MQRDTMIETKKRVTSANSDSLYEVQPDENDVPLKTPVVTVVGLGYVGLPLALLLEENGYQVRGLDIDEKKIFNLKNKNHISYLSDSENKKFRTSVIHIETDNAVLQDSDVIIVCVPTPVGENHEPDLDPLKSACNVIAHNISVGTLVVIESTINPGVCEELIIPMIERISGLRLGEDFYLAHCPERINPGDTEWDVSSIPRVIGADDSESLKRASEFYNSIIKKPVAQLSSLREAEAVKIVENSFRDINIAFVNELAISFDRMGIDVLKVIQAASTKPFAFMAHYPGCGVGGHCIPVDPYYLISYAAKNGFSHRFLSLARDINNGMPAYTIDVVENLLKSEGKELVGAHVTILGLAYKKNISDVRESPALDILDGLVQKGARVKTYDPRVIEDSTVKNLDDALQNADAVVIATDHDEFTSLTPRDFIDRGVHIVIDGKNCVSKQAFLDAGIRYKGIGR